MIIYGWNSKILKQAPLENLECENCKQQTTHIGIHSSYFHIFWIPVFPYSKSATLVCSSCQHVADEKHMAPDFKQKIKALKATVPFPKYQFSGLAIILAIVIYFSVEDLFKENQQSSYVHAPVAGDVYVLKDNEEKTIYKYYLVKVTDIEADSLHVSPNSFQYDQIPTKLDPKDGFYNYSLKLAKSTFLEKYEKGELQKVIRDYGSSSGFNNVVEADIEEMQHEESELSLN